MAQGHNGIKAQWQKSTAVQRHNGRMAQRHRGAEAQWRNGTEEQRLNGVMEQRRKGSMANRHTGGRGLNFFCDHYSISDGEYYLFDPVIAADHFVKFN